MIDINKDYRLKDNDNETCEIIDVTGDELVFTYIAEVPSIIDGCGDKKRVTDVMKINDFLELWEIKND